MADLVKVFTPTINVFPDSGGPGLRIDLDIDQEALLAGSQVDIHIGLLGELSGGEPGGGGSTPGPVASSLSVYTGAWTRDSAARLLRRVLHGPTYAEINQAATETLAAAVDRLISETQPDIGPLYHKQNTDVNFPIVVGDPWGVDSSPDKAVYFEDNYSTALRKQSLVEWYWKNMLTGGQGMMFALREFWRNHFGVDSSGWRNLFEMYEYINLCETFALGNFRDMVKAMARNPAMLRRLNGNVNDKTNPDENFAREIMELFVLGIESDTGIIGDFGTYTEDDVAELARVFTGMRTNDHNERPELTEGDYWFDASRHDESSKTFSDRLGGVIILGNGEAEIDEGIDMLFDQEAAKYFVIRELYTFFVSPIITADIEANVIRPLGDDLKAGGWEIEPVLRKLLSSQHFFAESLGYEMHRNPMQFVTGYLRPVGSYDISFLSDTQQEQAINWIGDQARLLGMDYTGPDAIAGFEPYRKPPWGDLWNSDQNLADKATILREFFTRNTSHGGFRYDMDYLAWLNSVPNVTNLEAVLDYFELVFIEPAVNAETRTAWREALNDQLPEQEWTIQINEYLDPATRASVRTNVENRIGSALLLVTGSHQYQVL